MSLSNVVAGAGKSLVEELVAELTAQAQVAIPSLFEAALQAVMARAVAKIAAPAAPAAPVHG